MSVLAALAVAAPRPAVADNNPQELFIRQAQHFYAYVGEGESLNATFAKARNTSAEPDAPVTVSVEGAGGVNPPICVISRSAAAGEACSFAGLTSGEAGIWRVSFRAGADRSTTDWYTWDITVRQGAVAVPGRVWSDFYLGVQPSEKDSTPIDVTLWFQQRFGYTYRGDFQNLTGIDSLFDASASGNRLADSCLPIYRSVDIPVPVTLRANGGGCGSYKIFFSPPSPDLPASAKSWDGTIDWIYPPQSAPSIDKLTFNRTSQTIAAGTIDFQTNNFVGPLAVQIDTNDDGDFTDDVDRTLVRFAQDPGEMSVAFDGKDGEGNNIPRVRPLRIQVLIDRAGEIHFVSGDIEGRGGLRVTHLAATGSRTMPLHWDDRSLDPDRPLSDGCGGTPVRDARTGVDSVTAVHAWAACDRGWGNQRYIDDWTFERLDPPVTKSIRLPGLPLVITNMPNRLFAGTGERIEYEVTINNLSSFPVSAEAPVPVADDLTDTLDDAVYNGDATATAGTVTYAEPVLRWTGPVPARGTVRVTYSVTVRQPSPGDRLVRSVVTAQGTTCTEGCAAITLVNVPGQPVRR
jgi:hypothetical protein